ncbi:MAG: succinate dehydrogenase [Candidatus Omnitrophica bacterium]|nr:succinate dehydrogenase [Candidatus Omnitrophota bacterium]
MTKISSSFILKRLHSLSGVFPIGFFLLEHMFTNAFILGGPEAYNHKIEFLRNLPFVVFLEITFIGLPILYHAGYGIFITLSGKSNLSSYPYPQNFLYTLQRVTGIAALIYIGYHVYETRIVNALYGTEVSFARMQEIMSIPFMFWFYIAGLAAVCFHFANGVWGFCVSWGITISAKSQRNFGIGFGALGLLIFIVGTLSLIRLVS